MAWGGTAGLIVSAFGGWLVVELSVMETLSAKKKVAASSERTSRFATSSSIVHRTETKTGSLLSTVCLMCVHRRRAPPFY